MARNRNTPALYGEWEFSEKIFIFIYFSKTKAVLK
jgi:hypothetical protein